MLFVLLALYSFEILCIFIFVVYSIVAFLMIMYNTETEALRNCIVLQNAILDLEIPGETESPEIVANKLELLAEKLSEQERALQRSHSEIKKNAEQVLSDLESRTSNYKDGYRSLVIELKKDVRKTEEEVKTLQNQISSLSDRREAFVNEVLKQQEDYQKMLNNFARNLEYKKSLFSSCMKNRETLDIDYRIKKFSRCNCGDTISSFHRASSREDKQIEETFYVRSNRYFI